MTSSVLDRKEYSRERRILRTRISKEGHQIDWTKIMEIRVTKEKPDTIMYKMSHNDHQFYELKILEARQSTSGIMLDRPSGAYTSPPKLLEGKYKDLESLCRGNTPVITHPEHVSFYLNLPH